MVPRAGLEPARDKARDFKSLVSADFTTWANMVGPAGFEPATKRL